VRDTLTAALRAAGELPGGVEIVSLDQQQGGWSRHTWIAVTADGTRHVVRVRPPGALLDTDLELEYRVQEALQGSGVPAPRVYGLHTRDNPFGGPFYVMEHRPGSAPGMYDRADQAALAADFAGPRGIATDMVATLAAIHGLDPAKLPETIPHRSFAEVAATWRAVYDERRLVRDPVVEEAFDWLEHHAPAGERLGLVHGDYRIGNTLVHEGRVSAVLDWELVYAGDVRFDLGYLVRDRAAGKHLRRRSALMGTFADEGWFLERYGELTGAPVTRDELRAFELLSITMLLATQTTAVWMHRHGLTSDFRMAWARWSFPGFRDDMVRLMDW